MVINKNLQDIANILRRDSLMMTTASGSGHPTSCSSIAEVMSVLFFGEMSYDTKNPYNPNNDEFILSKGHAAPILYSALQRSKCINEDLLSLRKLSSPLEGHPMPRSLDWIKVASGSLGQGLSIGVGMSLAIKLQKRKSRVFVLLGDSECAEGSVYEALELASHYRLNNLVAIVDINRLGQRGETMLSHNIAEYKRRFLGFGCNVISINGHNIQEIKNALKKSKASKKPTIILAKTFKGKDFKSIENKNGWHGKALNKEQLSKALEFIDIPKMPTFKIKKPKKLKTNYKKSKLNSTNYNKKDKVSTREAYGKALANLAKSDARVIALDAEVSNSTFSNKVKEKNPNQFVECYIAEQNMIGVALGLQKKEYKTYSSTFAAFLTRAHDQIRMSAVSNPKGMVICGSHAGVSIGEDGASQMGLEDIAMARSLPNSTVLYPSDAVSTEKLLYQNKNSKGIIYVRTTRGKTPILYKKNETFPIGDFKVLKQSKKDKCVIVGAGITVHESLKAYQELKKSNKKNVAVVDIYSIKPFNAKKFVNFVKKHGKKVIVVEDHYYEGGIGEMLQSSIANEGIKVSHLAIKEIPHSGKPEELLKKYKIDANAIVNEIKKL